MNSKGRKMPGETDMAELGGEQRLVIALLRQMLVDSQSRRLEIRAPAIDFLTDHAMLTFWVELAGLDVEVVLRHVQAHLDHNEGESYAHVETTATTP